MFSDTSDEGDPIWLPTESGNHIRRATDSIGSYVSEGEYEDMVTEDGEMLQQHRTSLTTRLGYGVGGILAYIPNLITAFFLTAFLVEVALVDAFYAGWILLIGNIVDAFTDPLIGFLSDATPWGPKRTPWIGFSILPFCVFYIWLWLTPSFLSEQWTKVLYYTTMYILRTVFLTCIVVPYNSLSAEVTPSYDERSRLVVFRWLIAFGAGSLCVVIQSLLVEGFEEPSGLTNYRKGYAVAAVAESVIYTLSAVVLLLTVREPQVHKERVRSQFTVVKGIIKCLKNYPFLLLAVNFSASYVALSLVSSNLFFYIKYVLKLEEYFTLVLFVVIGSASIAVPIWGFVSIRIGKTRTFYIGGSIYVLLVGGLTFLPEDMNPYLLMVYTVGCGLGLGTLYVIPYSLIPDVIEVDELETGERREGAYFSLYVFFEKLCLAVAVALTNWVLGATGYESPNSETVGQQEGAYQPEATVYALRLMTGFIPAFLVLIGIVTLFFYPITKEKHTEILDQLAHQRRVKSSFEASRKRQSLGFNAISPKQGRARHPVLLTDSESEVEEGSVTHREVLSM